MRKNHKKEIGMIHNIPLNALRSFVIAAEHLSFTHAGEAMNVTPGAVSRLVKKLEQYLEIKLFSRTPHGLRLTDAGKKLLQEINPPFQALQNATQRARRQDDNQVRVICHPTFAARWLLPRWSDFYQKFPDVKVQMSTTLTDVDLTQDTDHDIAIQLDDPVDKASVQTDHRQTDISSTHFLNIETLPVCSPKIFSKGAGELASAKMLQESVLIHSVPLGNEWRNWLAAYRATMEDDAVNCALAKINPENGPEFQTLDLCIQAAIEGVGISIAIAAFVSEDLRAGRLIAPFTFTRPSRRSFHIQFRNQSANNPTIKLYRDWLIAQGGTPD